MTIATSETATQSSSTHCIIQQAPSPSSSSPSSNKRKNHDISEEESPLKISRVIQSYHIDRFECFRGVVSYFKDTPVDCIELILMYMNYKWLVKVGIFVPYFKERMYTEEFWVSFCENQRLIINLDLQPLAKIEFLRSMKVKKVYIKAKDIISDRSTVLKLFEYIATEGVDVELKIDSRNYSSIIEDIQPLEFKKLESIGGLNEKLFQLLVGGSDKEKIRDLHLTAPIRHDGVLFFQSLVSLNSLTYHCNISEDLEWINNSCRNLVRATFINPSGTLLYGLARFASSLKYLSIEVEDSSELSNYYTPILFDSLEVLEILGTLEPVQILLSVSQPYLQSLTYKQRRQSCSEEDVDLSLAIQSNLQEIYLENMYEEDYVRAIVGCASDTLTSLILIDCEMDSRSLLCRNLRCYFHSNEVDGTNILWENRGTLESFCCNTDEVRCLYPVHNTDLSISFCALRSLKILYSLRVGTLAMVRILDGCPYLSRLECTLAFNYSQLSNILKGRSIEHLHIGSMPSDQRTTRHNSISAVESIRTLRVDSSVSVKNMTDIVLSLPHLQSARFSVSNPESITMIYLLKLLENTMVDISEDDEVWWKKTIEDIFEPMYNKRVFEDPLLSVFHRSSYYQ
jgi:hypothetical protein